MIQFILTSAAGKRLIAKATASHPSIKKALNSGTVVIIAGTTNGYVAEELLKILGQSKDFIRDRFFRGVILPPNMKTTQTGRLSDESQFPGDVVIVNGVWQKGKTIFDVVDDLKEGDVIIKGANCIDLIKKKAGILIGHPRGGTIAVALQAVIGKRVRLILPVGLEKRISDDIDTIASILNSPGSNGPRLLPVPGEIITEIEAISILSCAKAMLIAGGGVCGAEGAVRISVEGELKEVETIRSIYDSIADEPPFLM